MTDKVYIYQLVDPRNGDIRYVGRTKNTKQRYAAYYSASNAIYRQNFWFQQWLAKMRVDKVKLIMEVIDETTPDKANELERYYIRKALDEGCELFNQRR